MYFAQNSTYADLATLSSSGTMNIARTAGTVTRTRLMRQVMAFSVTARYRPLPKSKARAADQAVYV